MQDINANDWYQIRRIDNDISLISEPFVKEFYRCNIWHVRGRNRDMLVDSGMGVVSLTEQLPQLTEKPCIAIASHTHFDHIGCHYEFEERWVHKDESEILEHPTRHNTLAEPYVDDDIFTGFPPSPYSSTEYTVKSAPATRLLENGDIIDLGNRQFEVIHTPGHSPGGIMIFEAESGTLFSGDTVYDGPLIHDAYHSDIEDYIVSMKKILDLSITVVHGGHFPSFDGGRYRELIHQFLLQNDR